jgi:hypothetical protein
VLDEALRDSGLTRFGRDLTRVLALCVFLLLGCNRQAPGTGVSQVPVDDSSTPAPEADGGELSWQISFINDQPLSYPRDARNTFVTGPDFAAELTFSQVVDADDFESALRRGVRGTGGDPVLTWENRRMVLFDVRGCSGRARIDFTPLARTSGLLRAAPLVIYCGSPKNVLDWSADRGTEVIGTVPANFVPAMTNSDQSAIFYHRMRASDGGSDVGVWLADFTTRRIKPLGVHYLGAELDTAFMDGASLVVSTGGDDVQLIGTNGVRVRQYDPENLGLIVGLVADDTRGRIALFEGTIDESGRTGDTRIRLVDRNMGEITRIDGAGKLSRLSGRWRTVDALWLDADTLAFIHWDNRFYGVVAIANISTRSITRTSIVADQLVGTLSDGRFIVRRQAGGRAGCWRLEAVDGSDTTPLCERLPGPSLAAVSPDGNLVALQLPDTGQVVIWNRVSGERRLIGTGDLAGWTPDGELRWISEQESPGAPDDGLL